MPKEEGSSLPSSLTNSLASQKQFDPEHPGVELPDQKDQGETFDPQNPGVKLQDPKDFDPSNPGVELQDPNEGNQPQDKTIPNTEGPTLNNVSSEKPEETENDSRTPTIEVMDIQKNKEIMISLENRYPNTFYSRNDTLGRQILIKKEFTREQRSKLTRIKEEGKLGETALIDIPVEDRPTPDTGRLVYTESGPGHLFMTLKDKSYTWDDQWNPDLFNNPSVLTSITDMISKSKRNEGNSVEIPLEQSSDKSSDTPVLIVWAPYIDLVDDLSYGKNAMARLKDKFIATDIAHRDNPSSELSAEAILENLL